MKTNFAALSTEEKETYATLMLRPIKSAEQLKEWILTFFGLDMPFGHVDPDSNSSPVEAMWTIYQTIKDNTGEENPGYIMLSAREALQDTFGIYSRSSIDDPFSDDDCTHGRHQRSIC